MEITERMRELEKRMDLVLVSLLFIPWFKLLLKCYEE